MSAPVPCAEHGFDDEEAIREGVAVAEALMADTSLAFDSDRARLARAVMVLVRGKQPAGAPPSPEEMARDWLPDDLSPRRLPVNVLPIFAAGVAAERARAATRERELAAEVKSYLDSCYRLQREHADAMAEAGKRHAAEVGRLRSALENVALLRDWRAALPALGTDP